MDFTSYGTDEKLDALVDSPHIQTRIDVANVGYGLDALAKDPAEDVRMAVANICMHYNNSKDILAELANDESVAVRKVVSLVAKGDLLNTIIDNEKNDDVVIVAYLSKQDELTKNLQKQSDTEYPLSDIQLIKQQLSDINDVILIYNINKISSFDKQIDDMKLSENNGKADTINELKKEKNYYVNNLTKLLQIYDEPQIISSEKLHLTASEQVYGTIDNRIYNVVVGKTQNDVDITLKVDARKYGNGEHKFTKQDLYIDKLAMNLPKEILDVPLSSKIYDCVAAAYTNDLLPIVDVMHKDNDKSNFVDRLSHLYDFYEVGKKEFLFRHPDISTEQYNNTENIVYTIQSVSSLQNDIINCCQTYAPKGDETHIVRGNNEYFARLEYGLLRIELQSDIYNVDKTFTADVYLGRQAEIKDGQKYEPNSEDELVISIPLVSQNGNFDISENIYSIQSELLNENVVSNINAEYKCECGLHEYYNKEEEKIQPLRGAAVLDAHQKDKPSKQKDMLEK